MPATVRPSFFGWELCDHQDQAYRDIVLPPDVEARVSVELAATFCWSHYVGRDGTAIGMTTFGASAPLEHLRKKFGFHVDGVVEEAKKSIEKNKK